MIEGVVAGVVWTAFAAGALARRYSSGRRRLRAWREAADACGIEDVRESTFLGLPDEISGHEGRFDVEIGSFKDGRHRRGTRVTVSGVDFVSELRLKPEGRTAQMVLRAVGAREVEVGDPDFDDRFLVQGPPAVALAVLDERMRDLLRRSMGGETVVAGAPRWTTVESDAELAGGRLRFEIFERSGAWLELHLPGALKTILDLAHRLAEPVNVPRRLAQNAGRDPLWAVRLASLKALHREYPDATETKAALRDSLEDASEELRLHAASALGHEGRAALLDLAFGSATDEVAARAIAALCEHLPASRALAALDEALAAGRLETARACLDALPRAVPAPEPAAAEPRLVGALGHAEPRVRLAAALALGRLGGAAAVLPLQEAAERFGGPLRGAARQAVAEIQSRLSGATPGQLSLAPSESGHVSLAETQGGEVSLRDEEH